MKIILAMIILTGIYAGVILAPKEIAPTGQSAVNGLAPAASAPSFMPMHVTGPNTAKKACPLCIYGNEPQLQIWVQESQLDRGLQIAEWADRDLGGQAQTYIIVVPTRGENPADSSLSLSRAARIGSAFVTYVPSWTDKESSGLYNHTDASKPGIRLYSVVNRRLFSRWDNPKTSDWTQVVEKVKESAKYAVGHTLTDRQIAPAWEPGERFRVVFEVYDRSGKPVRNTKVTAWQTDAAGLYNPRSFGHIAPRLQVMAWTDSNGRIEFDTIFPGPYPDRPEPSHIHFAVPVNGRNQWRTLWFEGDPLLTSEKRKWEQENEETLVVKLDKSKSPWSTYHRFVVK